MRASWERASASSSHHSGTMLRALPPEIRPTFAVVSSSIRPSRRSAIAFDGGHDRGPAFLRDHPRVRRPAVEADEHRALVRRAHDHVADRRGLVVDEPQLGLQLRVVERPRAEQADLLLGREEQLDACVRASLLRRSAARPRSSRRRPTCCPPRGSSRPRSGRRRPRPPARAARAAAPCRDARRRRSASHPRRGRAVGRGDSRSWSRSQRRRRPPRPRARARRSSLITRSATARSSPGGLGVAHSSVKRSRTAVIGTILDSAVADFPNLRKPSTI